MVLAKIVVVRTETSPFRKYYVLYVYESFIFLYEYGFACYNACKCNALRCTMCLDTLYCNMKCWNEDYAFYHRWECPGSQMGLWQQNGIARLALKVFLMCSTTSDRKRFNEVQKLITNLDKLPLKDLIAYGIVSIFIFAKTSTSMETPFFLFFFFFSFSLLPKSQSINFCCCCCCCFRRRPCLRSIS